MGSGDQEIAQGIGGFGVPLAVHQDDAEQVGILGIDVACVEALGGAGALFGGVELAEVVVGDGVQEVRLRIVEGVQLQGAGGDVGGGVCCVRGLVCAGGGGGGPAVRGRAGGGGGRPGGG